MPSYQTINFRPSLHMLRNHMNILESFLQIIGLEYAIRTTQIVNEVCYRFCLVYGVSASETKVDPIF